MGYFPPGWSLTPLTLIMVYARPLETTASMGVLDMALLYSSGSSSSSSGSASGFGTRAPSSSSSSAAAASSAWLFLMKSSSISTRSAKKSSSSSSRGSYSTPPAPDSSSLPTYTTCGSACVLKALTYFMANEKYPSAPGWPSFSFGFGPVRFTTPICTTLSRSRGRAAASRSGRSTPSTRTGRNAPKGSRMVCQVDALHTKSASYCTRDSSKSSARRKKEYLLLSAWLYAWKRIPLKRLKLSFRMGDFSNDCPTGS
mmetsp:Transcript_93837/g.248125  ORF Transcript_93837/g.248125 Transcript_93837/m.248125 type:complete len:256 (+) Transcript_93837:535-1302(+)